jgi:hypothetical protein
METKRYIGIDLHRNCFTACVRLENGKNYLSEWKLEELPRFTKKLRVPEGRVSILRRKPSSVPSRARS